MKRQIPLLLIALLIVSYANAQLDKPHFISLNVGTSIPVADYKKVQDELSGGAENGFSYSLEGAAYFNKFLGIGANLGLFNNGVDSDEIVNKLQNDLNAPNSSISADDWINGYAMIGPYLSFGTEKIIVDFKFLAGLMTTKKPILEVNSTSNVGIPTSAEEVVASNLGFNYGVHLRIKLISKLGLRINAEQFSCQQEFKGKLNSIDAMGNTTTTEETIEQQISTFNLGAGLVLTF